MTDGAMRRIRVAFRSLARSPGFTLPALAILAIGMAAATAVFTVVDSIVFRPLDLVDSERLVIVCEDHRRLEGLCIASPGNTEDLRAATALDELGFGRGWPFNLADDEGNTAVRGGLGTGSFFRALGVRPAFGRVFTDDEVGPDRNKVALLSHAFWTTRYGADPTVVGSTVRLEGEPYEIVGVLPADFDVPFDLGGIQLWTPPHFHPLDPEVRGWRGFRAIGRLAPRATLSAAGDELRGLYAGIALEHAEVDEEWRLRVAPLLDVVVGDARPVLLAFLGAAGLLLLIVCANVANLLLARGLGRRRDMAVRAALGADRSRLVGGMLGESLLLTAGATALALGLAGASTRLLLALAPPEIPRLDEVALDTRVLAFAAGLCVAATALFAVLPALRVTAMDLGTTLKDGARGGEGRGAMRLRSGLVIAELALSVVLLSSAGLLTRSFARYLAWDPGFDRDHLLSVSAFANYSKYASRAELFAMWREAEQAVAAVPGVEAVATASAGPLFGGGDGATPFLAEGSAEGGALPSAAWFDVGPAFFATLGVPVLAGRELTEADGLDVGRVAVVNEAFARAAWRDGEAVGRTVRLPELDLLVEVVGVVADVTPLTPGEAAAPQIYWSNRQLGRPATFFVVRASGDPASLSGAVTEAVLRVDPDLSLGSTRTLASQERRALVRPRFQLLVLAAFALAALALSAVGVYAVVAYAVARRVREMGIRMALGAGASDVVTLVLRSSLGLTALGIGVGLMAAGLVGRALRGMVPGVSPTDPLALGGAAAVLLVAAAVAALVPARRATRADPRRAMRAE
ncbi:MAG TPA: ADOP family duplicated permease [Longimicrobiales bacterium]|nr:ADOP family duplicated permease [Longimicrobiales bacterium]